MAKAAFTEADVRRAVRGAVLGGLELGAVEIHPGGVIRLLPAGAPSAPQSVEEANTCDGIFGCDS